MWQKPAFHAFSEMSSENAFYVIICVCLEIFCIKDWLQK